MTEAPQQFSQRRRSLLRSHHHQRAHQMAICFVVLASLMGCYFRLTWATAFMPRVALSTQQIMSRSRNDVVGDPSRIITTTPTPSGTQLQVSQELRGSWSTAGTTTSRLGVRKRVKAVLAKARSRGKESFTQTASTSFYPQTRSTGFVIPQTSPTPSRTPTPEPYYMGAAAVATYVPTTNDVQAADLFLFRNENDSINNELSAKPDRVLTAADDPDVPSPALEEGSSSALAAETPLLPFKLPTLSPMQRQLLAAGERIQEQSKMGREGSGYVVVDVDAPDYVVWECLLDFEKYPSFIGTVREMKLSDMIARPTAYDVPAPTHCGATRYGTGLETRASFVLSKFRLNIAAVHTYQPHPAGHFMEFSLDKSCRNAVLKHAKGIWHTESNPDGREGVTRVWLLCELQVSSVLPSFIVDYTAKKAMPRASNWIRPTVLAKKREMNLS